VLALYTALAVLLLVAQRYDRLRPVAAAIFPFLDVLGAFSMQYRSAAFGASASTVAAAVYVLIVILSAFTLRPSLVWATALFACSAEALLANAPGGASVNPVAVGTVLLVAAAVASWATTRMHEGALRLGEEQAHGQRASELSEELVARLVNEEVQSRLATQRTEELVRANNHIAQVNAILKDQHRKLQLAQREAEKLTALLVHDMKGPLSSVLGFVELVAMQLGARPDAQSQVKHLKTALDQGRRLLNMIESLLAIARLERGAVTARREETDVLPLLQAVVNAQAPRAQAQGTLLGAQGEPDLKAAFDRDLTQRLLENLVTNALAHTKEGDRVELAASLDHGELVLCVCNSGPPIPDEVRGNLFERFVTSAKPGRGNVGLGLYFCRLVAEAHQGTIKIEDVPGWSVSFVVRVPAGVVGADARPMVKPLPLPHAPGLEAEAADKADESAISIPPSALPN
jgi:signal transduction histidine kinase